MSSKKKIKTDKEREQERCGTCDCFETAEGCECRRVPCSKCGCHEHLYDMNHPEFHSDYWFDGMSWYNKMTEILCDNCDNCDISDEGENEEDEGGGRWD